MMRRITTFALVGTLLVLGAAIFTVARGVSGGPLEPPGVPAPSQSIIEPRTPISQPASAAGFPIVINQPGSYYLTQNITGVAGKNGIEIPSGEVTLDLNGFTLTGVPGSGDGINVTGGGVANVRVRNGTIQGWGDDGIEGPSVFYARYEDLTILGGSDGILAGGQTFITRVTVSGQSLTGIRLSSSVGPAMVTDTVITAGPTSQFAILGDNVVVRRTQVVATATGGQGYAHAGSSLWVDESFAQGLTFAWVLDGNKGVVTRSTFLQAGGFAGIGTNNHVGSFAANGTGTVGSTDLWANIAY
jgi:hypothetical protein